MNSESDGYWLFLGKAINQEVSGHQTKDRQCAVSILKILITASVQQRKSSYLAPYRQFSRVTLCTSRQRKQIEKVQKKRKREENEVQQTKKRKSDVVDQVNCLDIPVPENCDMKHVNIGVQCTPVPKTKLPNTHKVKFRRMVRRNGKQ